MASTALAALVRWVLGDIVGQGIPPYITFYPAVMLGAVFGGTGAGVLATVLSALAAMVLFIPPYGSPAVSSWADVVGVTLFCGINLAICLLGGRLRAAWLRERSEAARQKATAEELAQAVEALREREQRLQACFDNAALGIVEVDAEDRIVAVNERFRQILGYRCEELVGRSISDLTVPEDRPRSDRLNAELHAGTRDRIDYEKRYLTRNRTPIWVHVAVSVIRDDSGRFLHSIGTVEDISQRKAAEAQVRLQAAALEAAANAISLSTADPERTIVWINPAFTELTGYSAEEAVGRSHHLLSSGGYNETFYHELWETIQRGEVWRGELVNRRKDGTLYHEEMGVTPLRDADGMITHYIAIKQDITARKRAEVALRESEGRFRSLADAVPLMIWQCKPDRSCDYFNKSWLEFTGRSIEQELGSGWVESLHDEDAQRCLAIFTAACQHRQPFEMEYRLRHHSGEYRWVLGRGQPRFGLDGAFMGYIGGCIDVTERKRAEEEAHAARISAERAREAAEEASRAKDHFLAVLSHELRTPLTPVLATLELLQSEPHLDHETRQSLELIRRNAELEARLIDDLLDLTRISRGKVELNRRTLPLCEVILHAVEVCQPDIEARQLHFAIDMGEAAPYLVEADSARLQQVFWNLLKNAIKFTPHGGCVGVRCRPLNGHYVVAEVIDSGQGIEPEALARIFKPFEQASTSITRQFGGLGLGLAISKALIEMHGGIIEARSEGKDKGATFSLRLPLALLVGEPAGGLVDEPPAAPEALSRPLNVLLVEDHGDTVKIMTRLMTRRGCRVQTAGDVATAIELAVQHNFDLLVSDLGLPDRSGLDLIRELRSRGQKLPAIALSGYGQEEDVRRSHEAGFNAHLTKPVDFEQFYRTIAAIAE